MIRLNVSSGPAVSFRLGEGAAPGMAVEQGRPVCLGGQPYAGDYTVTPDVVDQVLPTAGKHLGEDVRVVRIPLYEVSNQQNGITAYIGGEKYAD